MYYVYVCIYMLDSFFDESARDILISLLMIIIYIVLLLIYIVRDY